MNVSVVIPFFDEEKNIEPLFSELRPVLESLQCSYEVLVINDGSWDGTQRVLENEAKNWPALAVIQLRKNFGQAAALAAGFDAAQGKIIVTLDGDLQNDPAFIPKILARLEEGVDVVSGWRQRRQEAFLTRRVPSFIANGLISSLVGVPIHDTGCMLKAYRRSALENVHLYGELHRFLPALCAWDGAKVAEIPVEDRPRKFGVSKYGLGRTFKVLFDLLTVKFLMSYGTRPLHIFGRMGIGLMAPGFLLACWLVYQRCLGQPLASRPALLLAALLMILGAQFFVMGLLAELISRSYFESTGRKIYSIRSRIVKGVKSE